MLLEIYCTRDRKKSFYFFLLFSLILDILFLIFLLHFCIIWTSYVRILLQLCSGHCDTDIRHLSFLRNACTSNDAITLSHVNSFLRNVAVASSPNSGYFLFIAFIIISYSNITPVKGVPEKNWLSFSSIHGTC